MEKDITTLTGAGDDLIELEGELDEEFSAYNCEEGAIAFSDGTLMNVKYDEDGIWRFTLIAKGSLYDHKEEGDVIEDTNDIVYFKFGLKWCVFSKNMQKVIK